MISRRLIAHQQIELAQIFVQQLVGRVGRQRLLVVAQRLLILEASRVADKTGADHTVRKTQIDESGRVVCLPGQCKFEVGDRFGKSPLLDQVGADRQLVGRFGANRGGDLFFGLQFIKYAVSVPCVLGTASHSPADAAYHLR